MVGLGGREHARGLVEDQDLGAAVKGLEDLHALLVADAQILHPRVGIDVELVLLGQLAEEPARAGRARGAAAAPSSAPSTTFSSTEKFGTSLKCWNTMPMPAAMASWEEWISARRPLMAISPASAR